MADDQTTPTQETALERTLRGMVGETLAADADASESIVTTAFLDDWLSATNNNLNEAALLGWQFKLAHWANLVTVVDGASSRAFSDLMGHAQEMIEFYTDLTSGTVRKRARVGKIVRS